MVPHFQSCFSYYVIGKLCTVAKKDESFDLKTQKGVLEAFWKALLNPHSIVKHTSKPQSQAFGITLPLHKCEDHLSSTKEKAS